MSTTLKPSRARRQHAPRSTSNAGRHSTAKYRSAIGYVRVSRVNGRDKRNGGESYLSKEIQREKVEALAKLYDLKIVAWYEDEDRSGKDWERPGFQAMLADIQDGVASCAVVATLSRFARRVVIAERALQMIEGEDKRKPRGQLICGDVNVDTRTPSGRMMRGFLTLIAEWELDTKTEGWLDARERAIGKGVFARKVPVGYTRDAKRRLVPDPDTRQLVRGAFKRRADGLSYVEILRWWDAQGGPSITQGGLRKVFDNRVYLGEWSESGELAGTHAPLVTLDLFEDVRVGPNLYPARREGSLLAGIVACSSCGRPMTTSRARRLPDGSMGKRTYRCTGQLKSVDPCTQRMSVDMEMTDAIVDEAFLSWARARNVAAEGNADVIEYEEALAAEDEAGVELERFAETQSASRFPERLQKGLAKREQALADAQACVAEIRASKRVETIRTTVVDEWPKLSVAERRVLVASAIERVVVHPRLSPRRLRPEAALAAVGERLTIVGLGA